MIATQIDTDQQDLQNETRLTKEDKRTTGPQDNAVREERFSRKEHKEPSAAEPQPNRAERLECVQLAGANVFHWVIERGSRLHALQMLRESAASCNILAACEQVGLWQKGGAAPLPR